ncbi:MAG: hypothetical protein UX08_C0011G0006 [Candidatus Collierbacteria bacterium GW2011_GWB1_45_35]|uniref:Uncharacterized protein n=2 Tax=Candidatus Collieribacteriota TaxID=1752725 RepID=A0A0G1KQ46_9BACT|nr:MAG: hypothetical protein UW48_C0010G0019 [Microgenomates group bacterium GW2011_GWC1_44_23]KKT85786.1 MAG: hypothetical protein UW84_C0022G0018 [Candidatus Collierbacteria bacterium GW2011_GWA2_44_99]KKT94837.1 MAG: hypothetical protein UW96_C0014G0006 [Candidatus Collierbacteria bacterium GW2011_GWA1_45_15]KKT99665.1 MAG: hypothetical protein UX01_C0008G0033 [Candidatus Collierbacteria bacterium GW2011_GWB2_45_17]KKU05080.1 MAG: hypothetical protein UX08_C0011G0006 [Candidatus Collierbacte
MTTVVFEKSFFVRFLLLILSRSGFDHQHLHVMVPESHEENPYVHIKDHGITLMKVKICISLVSDQPAKIYIEPINIKTETLLDFADKADKMIKSRAKIFIS